MKNKMSTCFTLVELLVVISVISILCSILLPALSSAKGKAQTVFCMNNQKQLGTLFAMYAQDNDYIYPIRCCTSSDYPWAMSFSEIRNGKSKDLIWCPENTKHGNSVSNSYGVRIESWGASYENQAGPGDYWLSSGTSSIALNIRRMTHPGRYFFLSDSVRYGTTDPGAGAYLLNVAMKMGMWEVHNNAVNMLYVDGHVQSNKPSDVKQELHMIENYWRSEILRFKDYRYADAF